MSTVAARLPLLLLAAAAGVGAAMISSAPGGPSHGERPIGGLPAGYATALYVPAQAEAETEQAWTQLAAAIELIRSSRGNVTLAESLRGTAARLALISRENVEARKEESDPDALESARYQQLLAEAQLGLAENLLAKARKTLEGALVIFESARQNAFQQQQEGGEPEDPADEARGDPPDLHKASRPQGAARRSRHL